MTESIRVFRWMVNLQKKDLLPMSVSLILHYYLLVNKQQLFIVQVLELAAIIVMILLYLKGHVAVLSVFRVMMMLVW